MASLLVLGFAGLLGWLAYLQVHQHERLERLALENLQRKTVRTARRGNILDSRGTALAVSVPTKTVCANPSFVFTQRELVARTVASTLNLKEADVMAALTPRVHTNSAGDVVTNSYVVLKRKVPLEQWQQVTQAMAHLNLGPFEKRPRSSLKVAVNALRYRAIFGVDDHLRQYPSRSLAAQILGYVESGETETDNGRVFEDHGVTGIELTLDADLSGVHGWVGGGEDISARDGLNAVLTIDANVQHIAEEELTAAAQKYSPLSACAIVVRPRTGEILALANWPTFDPNEPGQSIAGQRNHAISDQWEPGSTFKIMTITTALNDGLLSLGETVFCENGRWWYGKRYLHDHHPYGILTFENVVAKSSNIGTAKAALRLGKERLYNTITNFGFGFPTGIALPAESGGVVHPPAAWNGISITRVPIGHEVLATPLQMVLAMGAIANGGTLLAPKIVDRLEDQSGRVVRTFPPRPLRRVASEAACREMKRALHTVASQDGTASSAQLDYYTVGGKTGTAEKFINGTYKSQKYYASFIGFLPIDQPELCILVALDEPDRRVGHMGGAVAGPVFRAIAERTANYLRLPPDIIPEPGNDSRRPPRGQGASDLASKKGGPSSPEPAPVRNR